MSQIAADDSDIGNATTAEGSNLTSNERFVGEFHQAFRPALGEGAHAAAAAGGENDGTHRSGFEKSGEQHDIICGEGIQTFRMPHEADHSMVRVPDGLDNAIIGDRPASEWWVYFRGSKVVVAIDLDSLAID